MKSMPFWEKILFCTVICILSSAILEGGARIIYKMVHGSWYSRSKFKKQMVSSATYLDTTLADAATHQGGRINPVWKVKTVIHPYLGFVEDPQTNTSPISDYGFFCHPGAENPVLKRSSNRLNVAILGGSFAEGVYRDGASTLIETLKSTGKDIALVNLASRAYAQPQQLATLAFFLALGSEYDIVINLDGHNEVVVPMFGNIPRHVHPVYPYLWFDLANTVYTGDMLRELGIIATCQQNRQKWAKLFIRYGFYNSATLCTIWKARDKVFAHNILSAHSRLEKQKSERHFQYAVTGPPFSLTREKEQYAFVASYWKSCSLQMHRLCSANGIWYYHFLQPNQYVKGSKPMQPDEIEAAINDKSPSKKPIEKGYPLLQEVSTELRRQGVRYYDLTNIFENVRDKLYIDQCCHANAMGYQIVAKRIGQIIAEDYIRAVNK